MVNWGGKIMKKLVLALLVIGVGIPSSAALADDADDMAKMQQQLNAQVMQKPFTVEDTAKLDAYIKEAMKKDMKPEEKPPVAWQPGWTCANLMYSYYDYRNCMYYYRYYGHYW